MENLIMKCFLITEGLLVKLNLMMKNLMIICILLILISLIQTLILKDPHLLPQETKILKKIKKLIKF